MEKTVVLVKPDGVQRGLIGEIIHRFERKGLKLVGLKMLNLDDNLLDQWYEHHKDKPFFQGLKDFMKSYPIVAMVWQGIDASSTIATLTGDTKAREAQVGTIRGDFGMSQQYNLIHSSEDKAAAEKELKLMFKDDEIFSWDKSDSTHVYLPEER